MPAFLSNSPQPDTPRKGTGRFPPCHACGPHPAHLQIVWRPGLPEQLGIRDLHPAGAAGTRALANATGARVCGSIGIMKDMNRKHLLLLGPLSVAVAVTLSALALLWWPHPGVTKAEVEQLLGGTGLPFHGFAHQNPPRTFVWEGEDGSIAFVEFTDNSVISKKWEPSTESIADKLRRWLHLPK
jgi:hypothetical protein